jgi:hypothetical protein
MAHVALAPCELVPDEDGEEEEEHDEAGGEEEAGEEDDGTYGAVQQELLEAALGERAYVWVRPPAGTVGGGTFRVRIGECTLTLRTKAQWAGGPVRVSRDGFALAEAPLGAPVRPRALMGPATGAVASATAADAVASGAGGGVLTSGALLVPLPLALPIAGSTLRDEPLAAREAGAPSAASADVIGRRYVVRLPTSPWSAVAEPLLPVRLPDGRSALLRMSADARAGDTLYCVPEPPPPAATMAAESVALVDVPPSAAAGDTVVVHAPSGLLVRLTLPETWPPPASEPEAPPRRVRVRLPTAAC